MKTTPLSTQHSHQAFTLVELLTVIAIIGILAAILIPTVAKVRLSARKAQSTSNLRQVALGIELYVNDNKEFYPGKGRSSRSRWLHQVSPYLGIVPDMEDYGQPVYTPAYKLPIFHIPLTPSSLYQTGTAHGLYALNELIAKDYQIRGVNRREIAIPSRTILLAEGPWDQNISPLISAEEPYPQNSNGAAANYRSDKKPENGPAGTALYAYADGRVVTVQKWPGADAFKLDQ